MNNVCRINTGKKPVKIVYDMYKDKDLRRMLKVRKRMCMCGCREYVLTHKVCVIKEYDLPDHGDKAQLIWRYKEYVTMYNANMDSSDPVDISQLIRQLQTTEKLYSTRNLHKRSAPDTAVHNILFLSLN
jgi:E3 ubiquitin-protein ligase RAD18